MIIDATNLILGRMATKIAKKALLGEDIKVVNSENAVVSGRKQMVLARYKRMKDMGTHTKGPFLSRLPDRLVRRTIKRMLPHKNAKGRDAYERIMCYIGIPDDLKNQKADTIPEANVSRLQTLDYVSIKEICKHLGGKLR